MTPLITADERTRLLANGQARAAGQDTDPLPVVLGLIFLCTMIVWIFFWVPLYQFVTEKC